MLYIYAMVHLPNEKISLTNQPRIGAKLDVQNLRRKLLASSIKWYHFPVMHSIYAVVTLILILSHTNFQKSKGTLLALYQFIRYKYLREDQSMGQTVI